jgi:hypothetical protein
VFTATTPTSPSAASQPKPRGFVHPVVRPLPPRSIGDACRARRAQRSPRAATSTIDVSTSHSTGATSSV